MTLAIGRPHTVDSDLAVAALTYIAARQTRPTAHSVFKVPYDAEKRHLTEYLQPIVGDRYVAMDFGPVPSHLYDLLKHLRDPGSVLGVDPELAEVGRRHLAVKDQRRLEVLATCDLNALSQSAIDCLDAALEQERGMTFGERRPGRTKLHGRARSGTPRSELAPSCRRARGRWRSLTWGCACDPGAGVSLVSTTRPTPPPTPPTTPPPAPTPSASPSPACRAGTRAGARSASPTPAGGRGRSRAASSRC